MPASTFSHGDRVRVTEGHHWAKRATATIEQHPGAQPANCSRQVQSLQGMLTFYWVRFDEPQTDAEGDSGYVEAEIDERYLEHEQI